jgi:hypothetical protein
MDRQRGVENCTAHMDQGIATMLLSVPRLYKSTHLYTRLPSRNDTNIYCSKSPRMRETNRVTLTD